MKPESSPAQRNELDEPELQELLENYGNQLVSFKGESSTEEGTLRNALADPRCPLKEMLTPMSYEAQLLVIKQFIKIE